MIGAGLTAAGLAAAGVRFAEEVRSGLRGVVQIREREGGRSGRVLM